MASAVHEPIRIELNFSESGSSLAVQSRGGERQRFPVGFGRQGITCAGTSFEEGYTPLGRFRVNGILSEDTFVMMPALIEKSGRSEADLKRSLFRPMNAIDFNGDGTTGECGRAGAAHPAQLRGAGR